MAVSEKRVSETNRLRYIRILERFANSVVGYLSKSDKLTKERYEKKIANNKKYLDRIERIALYKGEYNDLEKLVFKMISYVDSETSMEKIQEELLYMKNQIEKSTNNRRYKKDKHANEKFKDWE